MKKHFLITIFCLIPFLAFSQKKSIDGFMDIPFGSNSATVKAAMIAKGAVKDDTLSQKDELGYDNFTMSDRKVTVAIFRFVDNKVWAAVFIFDDFNESGIFNYYDSFASDLNAVYGKGSIDNNFGNERNTLKIRRLKSGNNYCNTVWQSKNKNFIRLQFEPDSKLHIMLTYRNEVLWNLYDSRRRSDL